MIFTELIFTDKEKIVTLGNLLYNYYIIILYNIM